MASIGFYIGPFFVAYYGLMIVLGVIAASIVALIQTKRYAQSMNDFTAMAGVTALFSIVGAKILYLIVSWESIDFSRLSDFTYLNSLMTSGFVFYGGLLGALCSFPFSSRVLKIPVQEYLRSCVACIPVVHGFGRLGCHMVGCCYGVPYRGFGHLVYHSSPIAPNGIPLFPVQRTEAVGELIIATILLFFQKKLTGNKGIQLYLFLYSLMRLPLEFLRSDNLRGMWGSLSTSMIISILMIPSVIAWYSWDRVHSCKKRSSNESNEI